jgi:hypothetical protein
MQLTSLCFSLLLSMLASGLPLEGAPNHRLAQRSKTYAVVNVDGGSSTADDQTKTVQVTGAASTTTTTDTVTTTVVPVSKPASPTGSITSSRSNSRSASPGTNSSTTSISIQISTIPTTTPTPTTPPKSSATTKSEQVPGQSLVTVTITEDPAPTEWYDDGLWHTRYLVKTRWE